MTASSAMNRMAHGSAMSGMVHGSASGGLKFQLAKISATILQFLRSSDSTNGSLFLPKDSP